MSSGPFRLHGGSGSIIAAIQTPGAPRLSVPAYSPNSVIVSWPNPSTGFEVQENADLNTINWVNVSASPQVFGDEKLVTVTPPVRNRFYRLQKP